MKILWFLFLTTAGFAAGRPDVSPEYLDLLLAEKRYEEFSSLMGLGDPELAKPDLEESDENPMFNENLFEGDIIPNNEKQRQGINFQRYPGSRWPGNPANVPYVISSEFSARDRQTIETAIREWNSRVSCVKINPKRENDEDYVQVFPGRGCYSMLGRRGGEQPLSLGRGCVHKGITWHEFEHAIGFSHEHNRSDRDDFVEVLWNNIPPRWRSQYRKNDPRVYGLQSDYDYYSIMHYPMKAPGTNNDAFRIKKDGIDRNRIGGARDFTETDLRKISILYC